MSIANNLTNLDYVEWLIRNKKFVMEFNDWWATIHVRRQEANRAHSPWCVKNASCTTDSLIHDIVILWGEEKYVWHKMPGCTRFDVQDQHLRISRSLAMNSHAPWFARTTNGFKLKACIIVSITTHTLHKCKLTKHALKCFTALHTFPNAFVHEVRVPIEISSYSTNIKTTSII